MEHRHPFPEVMLQISLAAICCMLFNIPDQTNEGIPVLMYALLFGYSLVSYLVNALFLRKDRSTVSVVLLNILLICAGFAVALAMHLVRGVPSGLFIAASELVISIVAFRSVSGHLQMNLLTMCFDALAVLLLIYIVFTDLGSGKIPAAIPGIIGVAASFAGIIILRSGNRMFGRDRLFLAALVLAVLAIAFLICTIINTPLREGVTGMLAGLLAAFRFLGGLLKKFLLFLQGLFGTQETYAPVEMDMPGGAGFSGMEGEEELPSAGLGILILIGILAVIAAVIAIIVFRKHRFSGTKKVSGVRRNVVRDERVTLWKALQIWFRKVCRYLQVRIYFLKNSKTPAGRFYRIVRSCRHSNLALKNGETPQEFLTRYIGSLKPEDRRIPGLNRLVEELNLQLYK